MHHFEAAIAIIGINPYVYVPEEVLAALFAQHGKDRGPVPIKGTINGKPYQQTLVRYSGARRLYINTTMLARSPQRIGEVIQVTIGYDAADRSIAMHPKLAAALESNTAAKATFDTLTPSLQKEIVRYIAGLKSEASVDKNVARAIGYLLGKERFVGREPIKSQNSKSEK